MVYIFNSYVKLPEGMRILIWKWDPSKWALALPLWRFLKLHKFGRIIVPSWVKWTLDFHGFPSKPYKSPINPHMKLPKGTRAPEKPPPLRQSFPLSFRGQTIQAIVWQEATGLAGTSLCERIGAMALYLALFVLVVGMESRFQFKHTSPFSAWPSCGPKMVIYSGFSH